MDSAIIHSHWSWGISIWRTPHFHLAFIAALFSAGGDIVVFFPFVAILILVGLFAWLGRRRNKREHDSWD